MKGTIPFRHGTHLQGYELLRCFVGLFNAQYQYHLHGMLRKPLRTGLSSAFMHKAANFPSYIA